MKQCHQYQNKFDAECYKKLIAEYDKICHKFQSMGRNILLISDGVLDVTIHDLSLNWGVTFCKGLHFTFYQQKCFAE
jgi:hypothetical protein